MRRHGRASAATALAAASVLLAGCGSSGVKDASRAHRVRHSPAESTTPSAVAEARAEGLPVAPPAGAAARTGRVRPSSTWDSAELPSNWPDQDGPPRDGEIPADIAAIPDAVPQFESRSDFGNPDSYEVYGKKYVVLDDASGFRERGRASWYGKKFHGKKTSSGEPYDMFAMTGAHKTLPIPCYARVTNLDTGHSVVIKINDRGPFHDGRIVDVSYAAAVKLDMLGHGSIPVALEVVTPRNSPSPPVQIASRAAPPVPVAVTAPPVAIYANPAPLPVPAPEPVRVEARAAPVTAPAPQAAPVPIPPVPASPPVQIASAAPASQLSTRLSPSGRFLQAGLFSDPVNAVGLRDLIAGAGVGIDVGDIVLRSEERGGGFAYRVLIGPFSDPATLEQTRNRLAAANLPSVPVAE